METFKHLSIEELHRQLATEPENLQVLDIRDPQSFNLGRIPGAIHLTNESLPELLRQADMDAPTIVCCYHGISSQQAAQYLIAQDFTDVYSLDGGFTAWQAGYPDTVEK
mgnify:FL=1